MRRIAVLGLLLSSFLSAQKLPFDAHALMQVARISDPQVSPDGRTVAFTVQRIDLDGNKKAATVTPLAAISDELAKVGVGAMQATLTKTAETRQIAGFPCTVQT